MGSAARRGREPVTAAQGHSAFARVVLTEELGRGEAPGGLEVMLIDYYLWECGRSRWMGLALLSWGKPGSLSPAWRASGSVDPRGAIFHLLNPVSRDLEGLCRERKQVPFSLPMTGLILMAGLWDSNQKACDLVA